MHWHIDTDIVSLIVMTAVFVYNQKMQSPNERTLHNWRFSMCLLSEIGMQGLSSAARTN